MPSENTSHPYQFGAKWQEATAEKIRRMGYSVENLGQIHGSDLIVTSPKNSTFIEVKASELTQYRPGRKGYQFLLFKKNHTVERISENFIVLVCVPPSGNPAYYILPLHAIGDRNKIAITKSDPRRYHGRWKRYLENWQPMKEKLR
jgi:hypothetical protein